MPPKTLGTLLLCASSVTAPPPGVCRHHHRSLPQPYAYTSARSYAQHAQLPPETSSNSHPRSNCHANAHIHDPELLTWPTPTHPHKHLTPYQILCCQRGLPYSKSRFYALAKIYHPDACCHASSPVAHIPPHERVERYRLVVAAHGILSDDYKRRAYDQWGMGWVGHTPMQTFEARAWPADNDPRHNATWEDWERWHERNRREKEGWKEDDRTVYMSNFTFMSMVFGLVTIGGVVQGTRASNLTSSALERRDKVHKEASLELSRAQRATMMTGNRSERIKAFLDHREANLNGHGGEAYQRLLPPTENCGPESVVRKG